MRKASRSSHSHSARRTEPRTSPRKEPKQERSQATVDAILKGAAQVLVKVGYDRVTTGLVAAAAGVSVGSLYQYFPNKDAVLARLLREELETAANAMQVAVDSLGPKARLELRVHALLSALLAHKARDPRLHRALKTELGRIDGSRALKRLIDRSLGMVEQLLSAHVHELPLVEPQRAAFLVVNAVDGVMTAAVLAGPGSLDDQRLVDELTLLVMATLRALSKGASTQPARSPRATAAGERRRSQSKVSTHKTSIETVPVASLASVAT